MPDNADAHGHLQALRALHAVSTRVHASLDLTETLDAVAQGVVEAAGFGLAVVNLAEPNGDFTVVAAAGSDQLRDEMVGTVGGAAHWHELLRRAERWGALYFVDHRSGVPDSLYQWIPDIEVPADPNGWHPLDSLFAPLMAPTGEWVGVLSVDLPVSGMRPGPMQCEVLGLFAEHAAIAILHARMHSELTRSQGFLAYAATHDQLTGLANRTYLWARVAEAAAHPAQPVGVLIVDLDGFKEVNDGAGHDAGDEVLRAVARRMRGQMTDGDLLARLGGDEFVAVLTGISAVRALPETAERLRAAIARPITARAGALRVTASIGYAAGTTAGDFAALMRAADAAMYRVKRAGLRLP